MESGPSGGDQVFVLNLNAAGEVAGPIVTLQWAPVSVMLPSTGQPHSLSSITSTAATYTAYVVAEGPMREYSAAQLEKAKSLLPPCPARQSSYGTSGYAASFLQAHAAISPDKLGSSSDKVKGKGYGTIGWELPCVDAPWRLDTLCGLQRAAATLPARGLVTRLPLLFQASPPVDSKIQDSDRAKDSDSGSGLLSTESQVMQFVSI